MKTITLIIIIAIYQWPPGYGPGTPRPTTPPPVTTPPPYTPKPTTPTPKR